MRNFIIAGAFVAATAVLVPVALLNQAYPLTEGTVTAKTVEPEHEVRSAVMVGKVFVPTVSIIPEAYCVTIAEADEENYICITQAAFEAVEVGDHFKK